MVLTVARSIAKSVIQGILTNEYVVKYGKKHPRFFTWLRHRLSLRRPYGLSFTIGLIVSSATFLLFLGRIQDILSNDTFVEADVRIMNLIAAYRNITAAQVFLFFTYLGNWGTILTLGSILLILLWLRNKKRMMGYLIGGIAAAELSTVLVKFLMERARPDNAFSLINQEGYAFPSGHAVTATVFYGMVAYGIMKVLAKKGHRRVHLALTAFFLIMMIGISRMYLGVHWASDVVGGLLLGSTILFMLITLYIQDEHTGRTHHVIPYRPSKRLVKFVGAFLLSIELIYILHFFYTTPLVIRTHRKIDTTVTHVTTQNLKSYILGPDFPRYSETLSGRPMGPISFIIVGTQEKIVEAFESSGWFVAEKPNFKSAYRLFIAAMFNRSYETAPVTPGLLNSQPESFAFEKETPERTARMRHHTRFWLTNVQVNKKPVWVATASFDKGLRYYITHAISPDIDTERDYIKDDLEKSGDVKSVEKVNLVKPHMGSNQGGDIFFTNGEAYIIYMRD